MIRLLKRIPGDGGFELTSFTDELTPPYAILSHTWTNGQEVTYNELVAGTGTDKSGYAKIRFCGERATVDSLEYFWVDTCCIDKSTNDELSTAINSMFRWYKRAVKCYVYLTDVTVPEEVTNAEDFSMSWKQDFEQSRWFTRGWTLQELLAPASVEFFSVNGKRLGSRISLEQEIQNITGIPIEALEGQRLTTFSVEERMSWAARRKTTLKEDKVYCLLGIFRVYLPLIYGEGERHATSRLKEEIQKQQQRQARIELQDLPISSSLPFPRDELFVGREAQLQSIEQTILVRDAHRRMTIYGLGGCGKSALALEFAYRVLARHAGRLVFWVPAISRESFELAYREIAIRLRIPGTTDDNMDVKKLVKEKLSAESFGDWLMIVDNTDDPAILSSPTDSDPKSARLSDYLPHSCNGAILFTTRSRKAAVSLTSRYVLELKDMGQDEARQLLAHRIADQALLNDPVAVDQLLSMLTYLPLAVVQAAAFLNSNNTSVSEYISLFQDAGAEIELFSQQFEDPSRYQEKDSTIAKTWHISFDQIRKHDQLAAEYLSFMACIDRVNVPQSLLPSRGLLVQHVKALGTLTGYAFVTERQRTVQEVGREKFFDMHRLVHIASASWLHGHGEWTTWLHAVVDRLEELVPCGGHEGKEIWTPYLLHAMHTARLDDIGETTRASLLDRVGRCQTSLGQYAAAEVTHREASSLREYALGPEHSDTLASMSNLALIMDRQGKYEKAEAMNRQTLVRMDKALGSEHPSTLMSMSNLALVLDSQGKYKEAEAMNRKTLARREDVLGPEHPDTLTSMSNLASLLGRQGKYEEAEAMSRRELECTKKLLGSEHPDTLTSMSNLALVLDSQGKYKEAEVINIQTLARYEKVLGPEHPDTLTIMSNLALVLDRQGKYEEAEVMNRQTLSWREKVLGPEHPSTLMSMSNLALVLDSQGKYKAAEAMNRKTLAQREKVLGLEHPDTMTSMSNLALVLDRQGKYQEAEAINEQTLARNEKVLGPEHPSTLTSMNNLALMLRRQGKYEEAEAMNRKELEFTMNVLGPDHPDALTSMSNLALVLDSQGKYEEAEAMNRKTILQREKVLGPEHPSTLKSMSNLALVLDKQAKYEEAEAMNRQMLVRYEKVLGPEHLDTLKTVYCLANLLAQLQRSDESAVMYQRAFAGYCAVLGRNHPTTLACYQQYSNLCGTKKQHRRACCFVAFKNDRHMSKSSGQGFR